MVLAWRSALSFGIWTVSLALAAGAALSPDRGEFTQVYHLSGTTQIPSHGLIEMNMDAELTELHRDGHGTRLMQLVLPRAPILVDASGTRHELLKPPYRVHRYPFYFRQTAHGNLLEVLHHPAESSISVDMKRDLACAHQLVGITGAVRRPPPRRLSAKPGRDARFWTAREHDVGGTADAQYSLRAHEHGWRLFKRLVYAHDDEYARPRGLAAPLPHDACKHLYRLHCWGCKP